MTRASYSSLSTFRRCKRQFAYRYVDRLSKDSTPGAPLLVGGWFHGILALDGLRRGLEAESLLDVPRDLGMVDGIDLELRPDTRTVTHRGETFPLEAETGVRLAEAWYASLESERREEIEERTSAPLPDRLAELLHRYRDRWSEEIESEEPLLVESWWSNTIPGTDITLSGRVDEVYRCRRRNIVVVRDHKLMGSWPREPDAVIDVMDSQQHLYAWGVSAALTEAAARRSMEAPGVSAVEWNRIRYKMPTRPKLTQKGALSKSVTDFDLPTYIEFTEEEGLDPDPKVVASLEADPDRFFRRRISPVNRNVVREHLRAARDEATEADKIERSEDAPRSPSSMCSWCDYLSLCRGQLIGSVPDDYDPRDYGLKARKSRR